LLLLLLLVDGVFIEGAQALPSSERMIGSILSIQERSGGSNRRERGDREELSSAVLRHLL